ncbi:GTP cyclohydrolase FolE2 [Pseudomonadales bacterium]|nr:GTP cyclohydrolase FolE2 [Pseudomonadales bacterium]
MMTSERNFQEGLPDIQSSVDDRNIAISRVGVTSIRWPIRFVSSSQQQITEQATIASFDMFVCLPADRKGTHMSRFLQLLNEWNSHFSIESLKSFCRTICEKLDSDDSYVTVRFPYFVDRLAPVTGEAGKIQLEITIDVKSGSQDDLVMTVTGPATSLCPCSKEISARGAHNQRCKLAVSFRCKTQTEISIEELYEMMEQSASTQIFPILKRPDEKWVTEAAYDNPKFVEDIVRDLALALSGDDRIAWYRCSSENYESIHQHNAFGEIESDRDLTSLS